MSQIRQLSAIMFSDIVGYTSHMGEDEQKAFDFLRKNRDLQRPTIERFNGRWIKELGDGVMASFNTVSEAVSAAIKIQEDCIAGHDFQLRIGIHLGEVVFENDDVFGDGVNIAARIQGMAKPGSIFISESVNQNVSNKKGIQTRFVNEETLKNVKEPLRIYEVILVDGIGSEVLVEASFAPSRPNSIAVLPFANMSSDPEQEYFSDGLTEEIISDLSKVNKLLVISRSSVMTFKGTQKKIKEIAAEVSVRFVLEGSVRKAGNNLRITAQLIDASNDSTIWTEKYNGTLEDVFDIQETVSRSIVEALKLRLSPEEVNLMAERPIANVHAYECYLKARQEVFRGDKESMESAFILIQSALDLVGPNDLLYAFMGYANFFYFRFVDKSDKSAFLKAKEYAQKAFALNPNAPLAHVVTGWIHIAEGRLQETARSMKRALAIDPNNHDAMFGLAETILYSEHALENLALVQKLVSIDPLTPMNYIMRGSFFIDGKMEEGLPDFIKAYEMDPYSPISQWMLACGYFWCRQNEKAYAMVDRLAAVAPDWSYTRQILFLKYGVMGDKEKALTYASPELIEEAKGDYHFAFHLSECYAVIGEQEKALDLLSFAMVVFFPYRFLMKDPLLFNLHDEPRFKDLIEDAKQRSLAFEV